MCGELKSPPVQLCLVTGQGCTMRTHLCFLPLCSLRLIRHCLLAATNASISCTLRDFTNLPYHCPITHLHQLSSAFARLRTFMTHLLGALRTPLALRRLTSRALMHCRRKLFAMCWGPGISGTLRGCTNLP